MLPILCLMVISVLKYGAAIAFFYKGFLMFIVSDKFDPV